jgi:flagellar biosynthesis protein FlhF
MTLKTFRAHTMAEALAAVKKDLGKDASILHTRQVKVGGVLGIGTRTVIEIIASDQPAPRRAARESTSVPLRAETATAAPRAHDRVAARVPSAGDAAVRRELFAELDRPAVPSAAAAAAYRKAATAPSVVDSATPRSSQQPAATPPPPVQAAASPAPAPIEQPAAIIMPVRERRASGDRIGRLTTQAPLAPQDADAAHSLHAELAAIRRMVTQVLQTTAPTWRQSPNEVAAADDTAHSHRGVTPGMPETLFLCYVQLIEHQVSRDLADALIGAVRDELSASQLADERAVRSSVLRRLERLIPIADTPAVPMRARDGRPLTIALVGPTGVGKTTTIAKLAASFKLRHGKRVGLITADTYRIAAVDQLRTYAGIISLPLKVVLSPEEMRAACQSLTHCDVILIDTAGRSQHNVDRVAELREMLRAADPHETHLVMSSAADESVLHRTAEVFKAVNPNRIIMTKLDEAVNFGVLVNVVRRAGAALSFVTTGQEVPDHIEPGRADRLAKLILDGHLSGGAIDGVSESCSDDVTRERARQHTAMSMEART